MTVPLCPCTQPDLPKLIWPFRMPPRSLSPQQKAVFTAAVALIESDRKLLVRLMRAATEVVDGYAGGSPNFEITDRGRFLEFTYGLIVARVRDDMLQRAYRLVLQGLVEPEQMPFERAWFVIGALPTRLELVSRSGFDEFADAVVDESAMWTVSSFGAGGVPITDVGREMLARFNNPEQ